MYSFEALRDHGSDAQKVGPFRRPVARAARAVLLARQHHQRHALLAILLRRVEDAHLLAVGEMQRPVALALGRELVTEADIAEGAAHHHLMIAPPRAVGVELPARHIAGDEELAGR